MIINRSTCMSMQFLSFGQKCLVPKAMQTKWTCSSSVYITVWGQLGGQLLHMHKTHSVACWSAVSMQTNRHHEGTKTTAQNTHAHTHTKSFDEIYIMWTVADSCIVEDTESLILALQWLHAFVDSMLL